jgi:uncharacterized membrane protein YbhN (UPF0104 family)
MATDTTNDIPKSGTGTRAVMVLGVLVMAVILWLLRGRMHLDWHSLREQFAAVSWSRVALGVLVITLCYWLRSARWAVLLSPVRKTRAIEVLPAQFIGFTGVAIFGRVADFTRPYMIAKRTETAVATQFAIYSMERTFDVASAAILFSVALAFAPESMPHHHEFVKAGMLSLAATVFLAVFAMAIRIEGQRLAAMTEHLLKGVAPKLASTAAEKVLDLQKGFAGISTFGEFVSAMTLSLLMWAGIACCYLLGATAFRATPQLAGFSASATMLVLATGIGGSVIQLPVLGWFTTIAIFATTLHGLFGVPLETATAAAAMIYAMTSLSVIPIGLVTAQVMGVGLRDGGRSEINR